MNVATKLGGFAVLLLLTFAAAFGVGRAVDSGDSPAPPVAVTSTTTTTMDHGGHP